MKICHVTSVHKLNDVRIFLKECKSLSKHYDVTLLGNDPNNDYYDENIKIVNIKIKFNNRIERIKNTSKIFLKEALKINADIYHLHDPELLNLATTLKKYNKKVVFDFHEDTPKQILAKHYIPMFLRRPISFAYKIEENRKAKQFDAIVAATPYLRDKFLKINKNTVDVNNFPILDEFINIPNIFSEKKYDLIYIGGISPERGLFEMVDIMNKLPDKSLLICGPFVSESYKEKALQKIKNNNITFSGVLNRNEIQDALKNSRIGLVLLKKNDRYAESLPIKMFEYMAASLPVIVTDFDLWKKIIDDAKSGYYFNPQNINDIVIYIENLLKDQENMKILGESGRKFVMDRYNWENEEKKLLNLYKKLEEK